MMPALKEEVRFNTKEEQDSCFANSDILPVTAISLSKRSGCLLF